MLSEEEYWDKIAAIKSVHMLTASAYNALSDLIVERAELLQRIEAAELSEDIARKDSRKFEEFYYGVREQVRNENVRLRAELDDCRVSSETLFRTAERWRNETVRLRAAVEAARRVEDAPLTGESVMVDKSAYETMCAKLKEAPDDKMPEV